MSQIWLVVLSAVTPFQAGVTFTGDIWLAGEEPWPDRACLNGYILGLNLRLNFHLGSQGNQITIPDLIKENECGLSTFSQFLPCKHEFYCFFHLKMF